MRKTALITGASAGFGVEFARMFAQHRNDVILTARRGDRLSELAASLESKYKINAHVIVADLAATDGTFQRLRGTEAQGEGEKGQPKAKAERQQQPEAAVPQHPKEDARS